MRKEIVFAAKRTDNGEWIEGFLTIMWGSHHIINKENENTAYLIDEDTICLSSGLSDKYGKPIRENDIVEFLGHRGKVVFECGSFGIAFSDTIDWEEVEKNILPVTGCNNSLATCMNDNFISLWEIMWNFNDEEERIETVEVVGNIFDNPELL